MSRTKSNVTVLEADTKLNTSHVPAKANKQGREDKEVEKAVEQKDETNASSKVMPNSKAPTRETTPGSEPQSRTPRLPGQQETIHPEHDAATERDSTSEPDKRLASPPLPTRFALGLTSGQLIQLMQEESNVEFFPDQHSRGFARVLALGKTPHYECLPINSRSFESRMIELSEAYAAKPTRASVIRQAVHEAQLQACRSPRRDIENRRTLVRGLVLIDLGDPDWNMVVVSRNGWKVRAQNQARFFRPQHMQALPNPTPGGDPVELFEYVPVESDDEKVLLLAWTLAAFYSGVPIPMLLLVGTQGSAKTTRSRMLRSLLDPSITPVLGESELSNLFQTFQHHAVPCFENVSRFNRKMADMFCRAVTGNGVEKRKLFTDSDAVLYSFQRPIIINGIDVPSTNSDFLDRSVIINCRRRQQFKPMRQLDAEFEKARPRLFGSLLDLLVKTLEKMEQVKPPTEFRMADFAHFGRAVTEASGKHADDFDRAYRLNIQHHNHDVLEASPMTRLVVSLAQRHSNERPWTGTATDLLTELQSVAHTRGDNDARRDLPRNPRSLSVQLGQLVTALVAQGVVVQRLPRTNTSRGWSVYMTSPAKSSRDERASTLAGAHDALSDDDIIERLQLVPVPEEEQE